MPLYFPRDKKEELYAGEFLPTDIGNILEPYSSFYLLFYLLFDVCSVSICALKVALDMQVLFPLK